MRHTVGSGGAIWDQPFDVFCQRRQMLLCRRAESVEPASAAQIKEKVASRKCIRQPEGDDRASRVEGVGDFSFNMGRSIGIF
jgi:hypothetical protein